jgi:1-deoxy-D-xylulose-5-phosphate synthase
MIKDILDYDFPQDLKKMDENELPLLAAQIREFLIDTLSKSGGHFASNMGIVEIAIALHKHFDSPKDKIVWDVGHQSYVHKILTGRAGGFESLRELDGMSGFPKRRESPHDIFDTGHSSTAPSLMQGLATARDLQNKNYQTIAVIGDGSMSGGLSYEALNNLGTMNSKSLVVLNDNSMSIGESTGGLENHLSKLRVSKGYQNLKKRIVRTSKNLPRGGEAVLKRMSKIRDSLKYIMVNGVIFEELGFTYIGPVDGHDIPSLLEHLKIADASEGPVLLHCLTTKGKGYKNAENDPSSFHGVGPFDVLTGKPLKKKSRDSWSDAFCKTMLDIAEENDKVVAITAAMIDGTGLAPFRDRFPNRTFDVGIAEAHAVSFAAGLAGGGMRPVVAIYSTFLQRAYDQIMMDVCLQNLPVIFAMDRAGNVGKDGETHHGLFDISYLQHMPNLTILAPSNRNELDRMLRYALTLDGPCAIRYPRGEVLEHEGYASGVQEGPVVISEGKDCELWAVGPMLKLAEDIKTILDEKGIDAGLVDARMLKPLHNDKIFKSAFRTKHIFTLEDNVIGGGFGEKLAAILTNVDVDVRSIAWPNAFIEQGSQDDLYLRYGFNAEELAERIATLFEEKA